MVLLHHGTIWISHDDMLSAMVHGGQHVIVGDPNSPYAIPLTHSESARGERRHQECSVGLWSRTAFNDVRHVLWLTFCGERGSSRVDRILPSRNENLELGSVELLIEYAKSRGAKVGAEVQQILDECDKTAEERFGDKIDPVVASTVLLFGNKNFCNWDSVGLGVMMCCRLSVVYFCENCTKNLRPSAPMGSRSIW